MLITFPFSFSKTLKWLNRCYRRRILKETAEQKAAQPGWEKDYLLTPAGNTSLYHEYLEMGRWMYSYSTIKVQIIFLDLILYVPSTIFQLYRGGSSWVEQVLSLDKCVLLKDHKAVMPVRLEPATLLSRVKHSTTEPLGSLSRVR